MTKKDNTTDMSTFEKMARENLNLSPKRLATFLTQATALRRNLKLRQKQQKERQTKCTHSK